MINVPGREKPVVRCYSLSAGSDPGQYRVSIKRVMAPADQPSVPAGLVSNYFHEQVNEGDILDVQAPRGHFVLDPERQRPAVLIAAGVGVTPLLSMLWGIINSRSGQEVMLFYGVRNGSDHAFKEELEELANQHANIRLVVCYSRPTPEDERNEGQAYHHQGRVSVDLLRGYLQSSNYDFYICGPAGMMDGLKTQLIKWGVNKGNVFTEAFGPATVKKVSAKPPTGKKGPVCRVTFTKSDKVVEWKADSENLLTLAEANGVKVESGCRAGNCGTCTVAVKSGEVDYLVEHGADLRDGDCLACIATPKGDIILDA
jgi:ferredoxin-NADP reductase